MPYGITHCYLPPGSGDFPPVAVQAGACLPGRWLLPRVWQYSALSTVSWCPDLRGTTNIQQLWWQNFCSRWTSFVELLLVQLRNPDMTLYTDCFDDSWTSEGTPFGSHAWSRIHGALWLLICSALEKHLHTYFTPAEVGTRFSHSGAMQGWDDLGDADGIILRNDWTAAYGQLFLSSTQLFGDVKWTVTVTFFARRINSYSLVVR